MSLEEKISMKNGEMDMSNDAPIVFEIEERLAGENGEAAGRELIEELVGHAGRLKAEMDRGLTPEDFKAATQLKEALDIAVQVVEKLKR